MTHKSSPVFLNLPAKTVDGRARAAAVAAAAAVECQPAAVIPYTSSGSVLILGPEPAAGAAAAALGKHTGLHGTALVTTGEREKVQTHPYDADEYPDFTFIHAEPAGLAGYLGHFQVQVATTEGPQFLEQTPGATSQAFDLVLDLSSSPLIKSEVPPPGYFAPGEDAGALQLALQEIPTMTGEFEKPQYFHYDPSICAHGRSGITACTRCLDACPTDAITSAGDEIAVNPNLCQGAGSCATACPTGAITYGYPRMSDTLQRLRKALGAYREADGAQAVVLFHDAQAGREAVNRSAALLPEHVLPMAVEELGSVGMDVWLAALAYGASTVLLLVTPALPASVHAEIEVQLSSAHAILAGMGYTSDVLQLVRAGDDGLVEMSAMRPPVLVQDPATFAALDEKRTMIRLAVDHLSAQAPAPRPMVSLPAGAPFGEILLDKERCTLCMACVSQCPAKALQAGDDRPQLKFIEANCVQCGLCCRSCPEDAIAASPRYLYDQEKSRALRVLFEDEPFCCIRCGKPFATHSVIGAITARLKRHAMFQGDALARIKMCEDCRVKDLYAGGQDPAVSDIPRGRLT